MPGDSPVFEPGLKAAGDLSTKEFYLMKHSSAGQVTTCTATTDVAVGSLYDPAESNEAGAPVNLAVPTPGHPVKAIVGVAGVTAGYVGPNSSGKLVNVTADKAVFFGYVYGTYVENDIALVHAVPGGYLAA